MKNSTRRVSMLLAVMMVLSLLAAFPTMVFAADTNYASGLTATVTRNGTEMALAGGSLAGLTDGVKATAEGTNAAHFFSGASNLVEFVFNLGAVKTDLQSVYVHVRDTFTVGGNNRGFDTTLASVAISNDNATWTTVNGNKSYAVTTADANYYDFNYAFYAAQSAQYVKVTLASTAYVLSLSEIEIRNYGLSTEAETSVAVSTDDPTLVEGNYAYGASYTVAKNGGDPTYRNATQTDDGTWLTDGYVGTGIANGTNYKTVSFSGTGAAVVITLTLTASHSDIGYVKFENVPPEGDSFCYPSGMAISTSTDGITYTAQTITEASVQDNASYDITYTFASAVTAQYIQISFTQAKYLMGLDEIVVGAAGTTVVPGDSSVISASPDVVTSTQATNYATNGYYAYGSNSSGLPHASYTDDLFVSNGYALENGVFGKGDLNDGVYSAAKFSDAAWVGFAHSEAYNTINAIEIIFDLAAVYGDVDQIVINSNIHGGAENYEMVDDITVSFGDYNGVYGAATQRYGTVTETAAVGYITYKAQFAVGDLTGNVRYVKISIPKAQYYLFIDEIEVIGASGYDVIPPEPSSEAPSTPDSSVETSTPDSSAETSTGNGNHYGEDDTSYVRDPIFDVSIEANLGMYDPDGADGTAYTEGEYIAVDVYITNIKPQWGIAGIDGRLEFDESKLVPLFKSDYELNAEVGVNPLPVYNWPSYTQNVTIPGAGTFEVSYFSVEGMCQPYAYVNADGSYTNVNPDPTSTQQYSMGNGYVRMNYVINIDNHVGYNTDKTCITNADSAQLRYYFSAKDGAFTPGDEFFFGVPDNPAADATGDALLRSPYYTGATDHSAFQTGFGRGAKTTLVIPEAPKATYTVTFTDGQGNQIGEAQTVEEGAAATAPADPTRVGYTFAGWDAEFDAVTADLTVNATWTPIMYTVTFTAGEGGTLSGTTSVEVAYGTDLSTVTFPTTVANDGYEFDAWSQTTGAITADTTVTATFKAVEVAADFWTPAAGADFTHVVVSTTTNYIYFKAAGLTAAEIKALFADTDVKVTKANGTTVVADTAKAGTTCLVTSTINGVSETREIVVLGDVTGDGLVNGTDYGMVLNAAKKNLTLADAKFAAANVIAPTTALINGSDYAMVLNFAKKNIASITSPVK